MITVEFIGIPGAGKSTLRKNVLNQLKGAGADLFGSEEILFKELIAQKWSEDRITQSILKLLPEKIILKKVNHFFATSKLSLSAMCSFFVQYSELFSFVLNSDQFNSLQFNERKMALAFFLSSAAVYQMCNDSVDKETVVVFDEGFYQRTISMFLSPNIKNQISYEQIRAYINSVPLTDVLIWVKADKKVCIQRMSSRKKGFPRRVKNKDEIINYLKDAESVFEHLAKSYDEKKQVLIELEGTKDLKENTMKLCQYISKAVINQQ